MTRCFYILYIIPVLCFSQNEKTSLKQTKYFTSAEIALKNNTIDKALSSFGKIKKWDSTSFEGKIATRRIDSLKSILRNNLIDGIEGIWKWEASGTNWGIDKNTSINNVDQYIEISGNSLLIYDLDKKTLEKKLVQKELLIFSNLTEIYPYYFDFEYSNGEFWRYTIKDNGQTLHLKHTGNLTENSRNVIDCGNKEITYSKVK